MAPWNNNTIFLLRFKFDKIKKNQFPIRIWFLFVFRSRAELATETHAQQKPFFSEMIQTAHMHSLPCTYWSKMFQIRKCLPNGNDRPKIATRLFRRLTYLIFHASQISFRTVALCTKLFPISHPLAGCSLLHLCACVFDSLLCVCVRVSVDNAFMHHPNVDAFTTRKRDREIGWIFFSCYCCCCRFRLRIRATVQSTTQWRSFYGVFVLSSRAAGRCPTVLNWQAPTPMAS